MKTPLLLIAALAFAQPNQRLIDMASSLSLPAAFAHVPSAAAPTAQQLVGEWELLYSASASGSDLSDSLDWQDPAVEIRKMSARRDGRDETWKGDYKRRGRLTIKADGTFIQLAPDYGSFPMGFGGYWSASGGKLTMRYTGRDTSVSDSSLSGGLLLLGSAVDNRQDMALFRKLP